jgi:hypothetical protein
LNVLQQNALPLYYILYNKRFHNNLFEWVNDIYPGKFNEGEFYIDMIRNRFDSLEEELIYNLLKKSFDNIIYNKRNVDNTITFDGMVPDYLIFTEKECVIGEYFGMYVPERADKSRRIDDYVNKTNKKIEKYKSIQYKKIFFYPEDVKNDMEGIKNKIAMLK